jgi:DNA-binding NarL/FixJ family response regulator
LTAREAEVLNRLASGKTNNEIAEELHVSVRTVERHNANIYAKIGARGRANATAYALTHNLI